MGTWPPVSPFSEYWHPGNENLPLREMVISLGRVSSFFGFWRPENAIFAES
jgi:hypothetical protein